MTGFALDYFMLVFLSALGVLLLVTAYHRLTGLLLMGRKSSIATGGLLVVGAFVRFFASEPRSIPDTGAVLDGNQQAVLFSISLLAALVVVLALSSLRNQSMNGQSEARGIDALREETYLRLIARKLRRPWNS
mgnify:CR=1 FL=1